MSDARRMARIEIIAARRWGRAWLIGIGCGVVITLAAMQVFR